MTTTKPNQTALSRLRSVLPRRQVNFEEARRIAELQASKLTELFTDAAGIQEHHIAGLPRFEVVREDISVSGMSYWNGRAWIIVLSKRDSLARQRFTLLHEFKHVVDHGSTSLLYVGDSERSAAEQAEAAADYFAGCALVGKRELKRAWGNHMQRVEDLADHFGVSVLAMRVRLAQTGLNLTRDRASAPRCARPISTPIGEKQRFKPYRQRYARRSFA